jgi:hypothetical protein
MDKMACPRVTGQDMQWNETDLILQVWTDALVCTVCRCSDRNFLSDAKVGMLTNKRICFFCCPLRIFGGSEHGGMRGFICCFLVQ